MKKLMYSAHLSKLLNADDIKAINLYLTRQPKMGIHILDRTFAIRKSNGLASFWRIDIYISLNGMIFLSRVEEDSTSPICVELDVA